MKLEASNAYLIAFYKEVQILLHSYTNYKNILKEIGLRSGDDEADFAGTVSDNEKNVLIQVRAALAASVERTYIQYQAIKGPCKIPKNEQIEQKYKLIDSHFIIKLNDARDYITEINKILVENILDKMGADILSQLEGLYQHGDN